MFADMGAEVIKIEPVGAGDEMRAHPRFPTDIPHPEKRRVPLPQHEQVCIAKTSMSTGGSKLPPLLQLVEQRSG
jgi:hypothetical protein